MAVTKSSDEHTTRSEDTGDDAAPVKPSTGEKGPNAQVKQPKTVEYARPTTAGARRGFFTLYKSGQGYWTRMGTLVAVGLLGLMLAYTLYDKIPPFVPAADTAALQAEIDRSQKLVNDSQGATDPSKRLSAADIDANRARITTDKGQIAALNQQRGTLAQRVGLGVGLGFLAIYSIIAMRMMNKPTNVDFLIATDSEMKKVNWTSRKELLGSTKVVVVFMFLVAAFLFLIDQLFHLLFWAGGHGVLRTAPFWWPQ